jgi:hypothetical protein
VNESGVAELSKVGSLARVVAEELAGQAGRPCDQLGEVIAEPEDASERSRCVRIGKRAFDDVVTEPTQPAQSRVRIGGITEDAEQLDPSFVAAPAVRQLAESTVRASESVSS